MGRWVRWFGSVQEFDEEAQARATALAPGSGARLMTVSAERARAVARHGGAAIAAMPTGQISVEALPAEMLTAVLVEEGVLTREDEHACLQEHRATGRSVEEVICESEIMTESELVSILSRRCKVPHLSLARYQIKPEVLDSVPADFVRANRVMPLERLGRILNVAVSNPLDVPAMRRLEEETGLRVKPVLATPRELTQCIDQHFPAPEVPEEAEPTQESFRISVKDLFKDSWLGAIEKGEEPTLPAEEVELAPSETEEPPVLADDTSPVPLSDDEAAAFVKTSSVELFDVWAASIGARLGADQMEAGSGGAEGVPALAAVPVAEAEFRIFAADEPGPIGRPRVEEPAAKTKRRRSARKKSKKKRKKKSGRD